MLSRYALQMYMHICIFRCLSFYIYIYIYIHIYIYIYICVRIHAYMYICYMPVYIYMFICPVGDPVFLGLCEASLAECGVKCVKKLQAQEELGLYCTMAESFSADADGDGDKDQ